MYKIISRYADNDSNEILLNKVRNGLLDYTAIACDRGLNMNFLLTDEQILVLVSKKIPVIFEGNKRRITISQIIRKNCFHYFHFAYLNDIFVLEDSKEIKEALKDIYLECYLNGHKKNIKSVFQIREKVMLFNPKRIEVFYTGYSRNSMVNIEVYPDGSMKVYEFLKDKYDNFYIDLNISYGTPEEDEEKQKILKSYDGFANSYVPYLGHENRAYITHDGHDVFDKKHQNKIRECISLFPELPSSKMYNLILEYLERIKTGLYSLKARAYHDIILIF